MQQPNKPVTTSKEDGLTREIERKVVKKELTTTGQPANAVPIAASPSVTGRESMRNGVLGALGVGSFVAGCCCAFRNPMLGALAVTAGFACLCSHIALSNHLTDRSCSSGNV